MSSGNRKASKNSELEEKENNFENFLKQQQHQLLLANDKADQPLQTVSVDELFELLEKNFDAYHNSVNLKAVLPFIHLNLRRYARLDHDKHDIGLTLLNFYEDHKKTEKDIAIVVQIIHQVLYSLNIYGNKEINVTRKVFTQLANELPSINDRKLVSNIISCIQLYIKMYSGNNDILQNIWTDLSQRLKPNSIRTKTHIDILMHLFDGFSETQPNLYCDITVVFTIQSLLKSNQRDDRKCGYYLFKKIINSFMLASQNVNNILFSTEYSQQIERSWLSYITILENLEENQSHLILPSLKNLNELIAGKQLQSSWMDILFMRIITHKNNLVLRWSIEYFLNTFTCSQLQSDILKQLLEACNSNILYNCEGYFLSKEYLSSFLKGDLSNLYELLGEINWKSIPLHNLLTILNENTPLPKSMTYEQVLKIAARVRTLQDCHIRQATVNVANKLFAGIVEKMTLSEYVTYVETLYNTTDRFSLLFEYLYKKTPKPGEMKERTIFKGRFYEILVSNIEYTTPEEFTKFLKQIPVAKHGWLKLLPFHFDFENGSQLQFTELYGINIIEYITNPLLTIFEDFDLNLCSDPTDKNEQEQRRISAIAFYVHNSNILDENEETLKIIFNYKLTEKTIRKLCRCLESSNRIIVDNWIIDHLIELVASVRTECEECHCICSYLERNDLCDVFIAKMLEKCPRFVRHCKSNILKYLKCTDFFCDDLKKGESRIEESYRVKFVGAIDTSRRDTWLHQIRTYGDEEYLLYLINCHKHISKKKSRYFANSYEHRIKMRIALAFTHAVRDDVDNISDCILDDLWNILLQENNQLNINYIYEYIVGTKDTRKQVFLRKLQEAHALTSSQQVSIISAMFTFCMRQIDKLSDDEKEAVVMNLMALTMGANFHTRLFAQMTLFKLLDSDGFKQVNCSTQILQSIEVATRGKLEEHFNDLRLLMYTFTVPSILWDVILYVTNAPYDEIVNALDVYNLSEDLRNNLSKCKTAFSAKKIDNSPEDVTQNDVNDQVQRKMNPLSDVLDTNNLMIYPVKENNNEMFVIASLIDKLPNLGGIARTCEVLGIHNLVMDSKRDIEKNDFKNLSMTAEKTLNIIEIKIKDLREFILNKQKEGYAVVGAEQTCNSENFVKFKFPEKCILLLGHEKDGIPPTLLGLLDHAVEIPQFGQVRSLNVHVTGALFMWEYCKQHLV